MKITTERVEEVTLGEFAVRHDLEMVVVERKEPIGSPMRFYAHFRSAEIKDGSMLAGVTGNGATPEDAIADYATKIEFELLVISAYSPSRREIRVPRITRQPPPSPKSAVQGATE